MEQEHLISVVLALLGVIQGLALGRLADKMPNGSHRDPASANSQKAMSAVHFAACFVIIIRVFQTYTSAAFAGAPFGLIDLISMFVVGMLQYWIIDALSNNNEPPSRLHFRILFLGVLAIILHGQTWFRFVQQKRLDQVTFEKWDVAIAAVIVLFCLVGHRSTSAPIKALMSLLIGILLIVNIAISVVMGGFS
jgi:hypothetical protein